MKREERATGPRSCQRPPGGGGAACLGRWQHAGVGQKQQLCGPPAGNAWRAPACAEGPRTVLPAVARAACGAGSNAAQPARSSFARSSTALEQEEEEEEEGEDDGVRTLLHGHAAAWARCCMDVCTLLHGRAPRPPSCACGWQGACPWARLYRLRGGSEPPLLTAHPPQLPCCKAACEVQPPQSSCNGVCTAAGPPCGYGLGRPKL